MRYSPRITAVTAVLGLTTLGLTTTPAEAGSVQCGGHNANVRGAAANESFDVYPNRVLVSSLSNPSIEPVIVWFPVYPRTQIVIHTGTGNDTITVHDDVSFVACLGGAAGDGTDEVFKDGGDARVFFGGDGKFTATDGNNRVRIEGYGSVVTGAGADRITARGGAVVDSGPGDDDIFIDDGDGWVNAGPGDDDIYIEGGDGWVNAGPGDDLIGVFEGDGWIDAGPGNDWIEVEGRAIVDAGSGDDRVRTREFSDQIESGPGADTIDAGAGEDRCDWTFSKRPSSGDTYTGCEQVFGLFTYMESPVRSLR